jgi:hypothetical protein
MVWGQILDPNVDQDTVRKLSSTAFYWCHKKHGDSNVKRYNTYFKGYKIALVAIVFGSAQTRQYPIFLI